MHKFKRALTVLLAFAMLLAFSACGETASKEIVLDVFAPQQALGIVSTLVNDYHKVQPNVSIRITYDEGAILAAKIEAGYNCDIFLSDDSYFLDWLDIAADPEINLNRNDRIFTDTRKEILTGPVNESYAADGQTEATYSIAVVKPSVDKDAAVAFIDFFISEDSNETFEEWGFARK